MSDDIPQMSGRRFAATLASAFLFLVVDTALHAVIGGAQGPAAAFFHAGAATVMPVVEGSVVLLLVIVTLSYAGTRRQP